MNAQGSDRQVMLPEQELGASLRALGRLFGRNIAADDAAVAGRIAPALSGTMDFASALTALLAGSGLEVMRVGEDVVVRRVSGTADAAIVVTGSRIRGAPSASTALAYRREEMRDAGQSSLADALRALPQNFGGGQNVGVGANVPESRGMNLDGASSINLRGLGSDATLTLLNGHRMSYSGAAQSVDISAIPFGAVERIEIVPDGASALFGSDAVAGVANIILRRDFEGLETSARLAGSTDGGNVQQQYGATAGQSWSSGNVMASYEFARSTRVTAEQRSYARDLTPGVTLYPALRHHNAAMTLQQQLMPGLTFDLDGLFNRRWQDSTLPLNAAGDLAVSRGDMWRSAKAWALAPQLRLNLGRNWELALAGSHGWSRSAFGVDYLIGGVASAGNSGVYRNITQSLELSGNGKLLDLPAGPAKIALGAGWRRTRFLRTGSTAAAYIKAAQHSYYGFAEFSLPVLAPGQSALGHRLDLSLAVRYEEYPAVSSVATPKFGAIYAPNEEVTLRASWGRSFRTPTLYEQYRPATASLEAERSYGGTGTGTVIVVDGGNVQLKPERSTNWSATLDLHPGWLRGAALEISYFDIRYRDRIVAPILYPSQSLADPDYAAFVSRNPGPDQQAAVLADVSSFTNYTSAAYDPAQVTAIIANGNVNAGRQRVQGIDVLGRYRQGFAGGVLLTSINASYITSRQQVSADQPVTILAGRLFSPPHWRARGDIGWSRGGLTLSGAANYIGPVRDARTASVARIAGMTPVDLTARYRMAANGGLASGMDVIVSVQNLFNDKPSVIRTTSYTNTPYDSTNYTPLGRVLSLTVTKAW